MAPLTKPEELTLIANAFHHAERQHLLDVVTQALRRQERRRSLDALMRLVGSGRAATRLRDIKK